MSQKLIDNQIKELVLAAETVAVNPALSAVPQNPIAGDAKEPVNAAETLTPLKPIDGDAKEPIKAAEPLAPLKPIDGDAKEAVKAAETLVKGDAKEPVKAAGTLAVRWSRMAQKPESNRFQQLASIIMSRICSCIEVDILLCGPSCDKLHHFDLNQMGLSSSLPIFSQCFWIRFLPVLQLHAKELQLDVQPDYGKLHGITIQWRRTQKDTQKDPKK